MNKSKRESIVRQIRDNLLEINAKKIILFGSYAYGNPTDESDIDICVIKEKIDSKINEKNTIRKLLKEIKISKDIILEEEEYFLSHSDENWINTALYDARHRGVVIYEQK